MFGRRLFLRGAGAAAAAAPLIAQHNLQAATGGSLAGSSVPPMVGGSGGKTPEALRLLWKQQDDVYTLHGRQRRYQMRTILAMRSWSPIFAEQQFAKMEDEHRTIERRIGDVIADMRERLGLS